MQTILRNLLALLLVSVGGGGGGGAAMADAFVFAPRSSSPSWSSVRSSRTGTLSKAAHRRDARRRSSSSSLSSASSLLTVALVVLLSVLSVLSAGVEAFTFGPARSSPPPTAAASSSFAFRGIISKAAHRRAIALSSLAMVEDAVADGATVGDDDSPADDNDDEDEWISLTPESPGAVSKRTLAEGTGSDDAVEKGTDVSIEYVGTLMPSGGGIPQWSARDVVECWLSSQQGVPDGLPEKFLSEGVDGTLLTDGTFTDEYVKDTLGIDNRIQCKKLSMAARRLATQVEEYPSPVDDPFVFDSSKERGKPYTFTLGAGKAIRGMDLAVASMKEGERAEMVCRADYAYGNEGLRKADGTVVVPPFATLKFEITLL